MLDFNTIISNNTPARRSEESRLVSFSAFKIQHRLRTVMTMAFMHEDLTEDDFVAEVEKKFQESNLEYLERWNIDLETLELAELKKLSRAGRELCRNLRLEAGKSDESLQALMEDLDRKKSVVAALRKRNELMHHYAVAQSAGDVYRAAVSLEGRLGRALRKTASLTLQACLRRALLRGRPSPRPGGNAASQDHGGRAATSGLPVWCGLGAEPRGSEDGHAMMLLAEEEELEEQLRRLGAVMIQ